MPMAMLAEVPLVQTLDPLLVARATFSGCLNEAAKHCGMEDHEIADKLPISHGYMSRFMRGVGQQWARRLVKYMQITNSIVPLQWIAEQMGCDVVLRSARDARIRILEAELANEMSRTRRAA
ncbi:MAG: hypothetical protein V4757_07300 [Pseudomonadota bacterium]